METILTKNRNGKLVVLIQNGDNSLNVGDTILVSPDLSYHRANGAKYDFQISGFGKTWKAKEDRYIIDENYSYDGQRKVGHVNVTRQYAYGRIVGRHKGILDTPCDW